MHSLPTKLGRSALLGEFIIEGGPNSTSQTLAIATSHLESYPQDFKCRREQLSIIFQILDKYSTSILTADFNFARKEEDQCIPSEYTDCWTVRYYFINIIILSLIFF